MPSLGQKALKLSHRRSRVDMSLITYLSNHVLFPPQLPQDLEADGEHNYIALLDFVLESAVDFGELVQNNKEADEDDFSAVIYSLKQAKELETRDGLDETQLSEAIGSLKHNESLVLYLDTQNCAIMIHCQQQEMTLEFFEAAPPNKEVMSSPGVLRRTFPGQSIVIPREQLTSASFLKSFASYVADLSYNTIEDFQPKVKKAGSNLIEVRDTTNPTAITDMLASILLSVGKHRAARTPVVKRTHEDVCWDDCFVPWRREPYWLVLRVAIQSILIRINGSQRGFALYKNFVAFVTSRISDQVCASNTDMLSHARAKLARRLDKNAERGILFAYLASGFQHVLTKINSMLSTDWSNTIQHCIRKVETIPQPCAADFQLRLKNCRPKVLSIISKSDQVRPAQDYDFDCPKRVDFSKVTFSNFDLSRFEAQGNELAIFLADFELWVEQESYEWDQQSRVTEDELRSATNIFYDYYRVARSFYCHNSDCASIMFLTLLEMWAFIDRVTLRLVPLLKSYKIRLPYKLLSRLRTSSLGNMGRASRIELYITTRTQQDDSIEWTIFTTAAQHSFASKYYETHPELHGVMQTIEDAENAARVAKHTEWLSMREKEAEMLSRASRTPCTGRLSKKRNLIHNSPCVKCRLEDQAAALRISPIETRLPADVKQRKLVIFELCSPESFRLWRDVLWHLTMDIARHDDLRCGSGSYMDIRNYRGLQAHTSDSDARLTLHSPVKSFLQAHYGAPKHCSVKYEDLLLPHALKWRLYDNQESCWVDEQDHLPSLIPDTKNLPKPANKTTALQSAMERCDITPNTVIAEQALCPPRALPSEFVNLRLLRAGERLQWLNMLVELNGPHVDFTYPTVNALFVQAALQLGTPKADDIHREAHWVFHDQLFCRKLLTRLLELYEDVQSNWQEVTLMKTILILLLRLISLDTDDQDADRKRLLLRQIRLTALKWVGELSDELRLQSGNEERERLSQKLFHAACLCRQTYAVHYLQTQIKFLEFDLEPFLYSGLVVDKHSPVWLEDAEASVAHGMLEEWRLAISMEQSVRKSILKDSGAINRAVTRYLESSYSFSTWKALPSPNHRWLTTVTNVPLWAEELTVHFNILTSELLVDGQPVSRLPDAYLGSSLYEYAFDKRHLDVVPSTLPGMTHRSVVKEMQQEVHFGWRKDSLVIRTVHNGRVRELLSKNVFGPCEDRDLPASIIDENAHWLEVQGPDRGVIHAIPEQDFWNTTSCYWRINVMQSNAGKALDQLVEASGLCATSISTALGRFESSRHLVVCKTEAESLAVRLPRLNLIFELNSAGNLFCTELNAYVSQRQDGGTLYGVESILILEDCIDHSKTILVPTGDIRYAKADRHVSVWTEPSSAREVSYARYKVNQLIGRLDNAGGEHDLLMEAYLHALTSHVEPDPLTGHSGTDEAFENLSEFRRRMFRPLNESSKSLLLAILRLTPTREYYPQHLRVSQRVCWDARLPPSSQHDCFRVMVQDILNHSADLEIFTGKSATELVFEGHDFLAARAAFRNSAYCRARVLPGAEKAVFDSDYIGRDRFSYSTRGFNAFEFANIARHWDSSIHVVPSIALEMERLNTIGGFHTTFQERGVAELLAMDLGTTWGEYYDRCRTANREKDSAYFVFMFGTLAFAEDAELQLLKPLLAVAILLADRAPMAPEIVACVDEYIYHKRPAAETIRKRLKSTARKPGEFPSTSDEQQSGEPQRKRPKKQGRLRDEDEYSQEIERASKELLKQWPCDQPDLSNMRYNRVDVAQAIDGMQDYWSSCFQAWLLSNFFDALQKQLRVEVPQTRYKWPNMSVVPDVPHQYLPHKASIPSLEDILGQTHTSEVPSDNIRGKLSEISASPGVFEEEDAFRPNDEEKVHELRALATLFERSCSETRAEVGTNLAHSIAALESMLATKPHEMVDGSLPEIESFKKCLTRRHSRVQESFDRLRDSLRHHSRFYWLNLGCLWPIVTTAALLGCLQQARADKMTPSLKTATVQLAHEMTEVQRYRRILRNALSKNSIAINFEMEQALAHDNWNIRGQTEWLLLEIESDMLLRKDQVITAMHMIKPDSDSNSIYQLQMGKGKSSIIVPACLTLLADRQQLARVIVTKPLLVQMAGILGRTMCRLMGRSLLHLPYSRSSTKDTLDMERYLHLHQEIFSSGGVVLCLPEHLLSFRLNAQQCLQDEKVAEAESMLNAQEWLDANSRDLMDESDQILSTRTQLIYPSGTQTGVDGGSHRWQVAQKLLRVVHESLPLIYCQHHTSISTFELRPKSFPLVHILRAEVENILMDAVIAKICGPESPIFATERVESGTMELIRQHLQDTWLSRKVYNNITCALDDQVDVQTFLTLRGLIGGGILTSCLKKRWNVNYGLSLSRCQVAVPYQAKGIPSPAAEFGHSDVAIMLTLLAYYYTGVSLVQFEQILHKISLESDPSLEWNKWSRETSDLPSTLRSWKAVNLEDYKQTQLLWRNMSHSMSLIDFFLDRLVFPREAREFDTKLVASSWDLPLKSGRLTTGFSGTNGNSRHMPLSIQQRQIPKELHTNAEVLYFLLQDRNRGLTCARNDEGKRLTTREFIQFMCKHSFQASTILDAGAQILDTTNREVAKMWLHERTDKLAAVYMDSDDVFQVIYRDWRTEKLANTPYSASLTNVLLYLDEAHCRGTDVRLPTDAKAFLTLGLYQTKDHLTQAAMRMRQLGIGQSVHFVTTPEVYQAILDHNELDCDGAADSSHVISWAMEQSCIEIDSLEPLFVSQGASFLRRDHVMDELLKDDMEQKQMLVHNVKEKERFSLVELYGPKDLMPSLRLSLPPSTMSEELQKRAQQMSHTSHLRQANANEEQERELEVQVEEQRHTQLPPAADPCEHVLHVDVEKFVRTGQRDPESKAYMRVFKALTSTSNGTFWQKGSSKSAARNIFATQDFKATVRLSSSEWYDEYLRAVRWILVSNVSGIMMTISPFEANALLPAIRQSKCIHLVVYDAAKTRQMVTRFGGLGFYSVPALPCSWEPDLETAIALGFFCGRQYFPWGEYLPLCKWLGKLSKALSAEKEKVTKGCVLQRTRLYLHELLAMRNYGVDCSHTPMGHIVRGRPLNETDHFFQLD